MKRFQRQQQRELSQLSTIMETSEQNGSCNMYPRRTTVNVNGYPEKDIILHMTGGGFFAHTIAGDLPYLIDWSGQTNAVVICPEYALLPDHSFPVALNQVTDIYYSLMGGTAIPLLGFRPARVIVTGESAGGNLAAALCVKLCMDGIVDLKKMSNEEVKATDVNNDDDTCSDALSSEENLVTKLRLPDAIMLCCPVLNLSLTMSPSRVVGDDDPVLPTGLISAISEAYLPSGRVCDPLASPYFAPDCVLCHFPNTLLFNSSGDPLLDDSVGFCSRLRRLGVDSELRAAHHMPHAYWGLGTAGFPEAKQVQNECRAWLVSQFARAREEARE